MTMTPQHPKTGSFSGAKRLLDIVVSFVGLVCVSPILLVLALMIRWKLGGPVLFRQKRGGYKGSVFLLCKFRTMQDLFDEDGQPLPDEQRLTSFGKWLRRTSLDELPTLWNVLRGEMSLVGPRPLLATYLERYTAEECRRHDAKPGITGWAQIHGRNAITWSEKFRYDVWYVTHQSFRLDLWILWKTVTLVLRRDGVEHSSGVTMPEFQGSSQPTGTSVIAQSASLSREKRLQP